MTTRNEMERVSLPEFLYDKEPVKAALYIILNILVVVGSGVLAWKIDRLWVSIVAFVLVGARAQALYVLQHEAMHRLLFSSPKINDLIGAFLSALLGTQFHEGRRIHFKHHAQVGTPDDPNEVWHGIENKQPGWQVTRFMISQLFGARLLGLVKKVFLSAPNSSETSNKVDFYLLLGVQFALFVFYSSVSSPITYFVFYLLPIACLTAFFEAVRSFSEHVLPANWIQKESDRWRLFYMKGAGPELFFVSQFHFNYHHLHHLYPNIVTFKMPKVHVWLQRNDSRYSEKYTERSGYFPVLFSYAFGGSRVIGGSRFLEGVHS